MSDAPLRWRRYPVEQAAFGPEATYQNGRLTIAAEALRAELLQDAHFAAVDLALVGPGERARIINVVDVVEPRIKPERAVPDYYPGLGADPFLVGSGPTNVLAGLCVMTTALLDQAEDTVVSTEPEQALRSRHADGWILVVSPAPAPGVPNEEFGRAVLTAGCRAAVVVARATLGAEPAERITLDATSPSTVGPRLGYLCYLYSHGFGRQKLVYGRESPGLLPTILPLPQLLDGALVDNGHTRSVRNSTYDLANNAIAYELAVGHGREHTCAGLVLVPHATELRYKAAFAEQAARLAHDVLRCDGVLISKDGGGQADVDVMEAVAACEALGMRTVAAVAELAGEAGDQFPVVTTVEQADALVSLGNHTEPVQFGPIERVIGGARFGRATADPHGSFTLPTGQVPGLTDFTGGTRVRTVVY
jgi:glycine reductase